MNDNTLDEEASSWYGFPVYKTSADFYMGWQGWTDGWSVSFQDSNDTRRFTDSFDKYVSASTWYHIVGIYGGSNLKIYRNSTSIRDASKVVTV